MTTTRTICPRCGRTLTSTRALRVGYGPRCYTHLLAALRTIALTHPAHQVAKAAELLEDGGLIPAPTTHKRPRQTVYIAVGTDGTETYRTTATTCTCPAARHGRSCYHVIAAQVMDMTHHRVQPLRRRFALAA